MGIALGHRLFRLRATQDARTSNSSNTSVSHPLFFLFPCAKIAVAWAIVILLTTVPLFVFSTAIAVAVCIIVLPARRGPATSTPTITTVYLEVWLAITANQPAPFKNPLATTTVPMEIAATAIRGQ